MLDTPRFGNQILCMEPRPKDVIDCMCFDGKICDIHINDGGNLICRHGSNEGVINGIATVICPLEIERESKKWGKFLQEEMKRK